MLLRIDVSSCWLPVLKTGLSSIAGRSNFDGFSDCASAVAGSSRSSICCLVRISECFCDGKVVKDNMWAF